MGVAPVTKRARPRNTVQGEERTQGEEGTHITIPFSSVNRCCTTTSVMFSRKAYLVGGGGGGGTCTCTSHM